MDQIKKIFSGEWWKWVFSGVGPWIIRTVGVVQRDQSNFTVKNGFTKEQDKKILEEQRQTIIEEVRVAAGNEEKLKLLDEKYSDIQNKLADLQKSYEERKKLLKQASEDLERIKGNLSDSQLTEAEEKLEKGETKAAEQAFDAVVDQGAGAVSLAAFRSGTLSEDRLDYEKTFRQYKKAAVLEEDNPEYLLAAGKMAQTLADYRQAQDWLEQLLKIREAEKKEDTHLASALYNLAWVYTFQGCYDKAEPLYKRTRAIFEKNLGKDHNEVVTTLNNLAGLYIKQGRYDDAKPLYRRTLAILKKTLGKDHHEVVTRQNNLADLYRHLGFYNEEVELLYKRVLAIREKTLGKDHHEVARTLNNLAWVYKSRGCYDKAEPLYKRVLAIHEKTLGKNHPSVATTLNSLAKYNGCNIVWGITYVAAKAIPQVSI